MLRLLQPKRYGGHEAHPTVFYSAVRLIASACGSTGWVSSVLGVHPWHVALFAEQAQQEVWHEDLDTVISSSYAPVGRATPVEGGFRVSGRWSFSSGSDHGAGACSVDWSWGRRGNRWTSGPSCCRARTT